MGSRLLGGTASGMSLLCLTVCSAAAQSPTQSFVARVLTSSTGVRMPYRLFVPASRARVLALPLIVYLHGGGGAGTDNLKQIAGGNLKGTHLWLRDDLQAEHPAFVVAPQAPTGAQWGTPNSDSLAPYAQLVVELIHTLTQEFAIDTGRLYLVGQSLGGRGVWDLITKRPHLFAAAVPFCGSGSPTRVAAARKVPVWAFHGAKDVAVPVAGSRELVNALREASGIVRYTEYPDVGHDVWNHAFAEPELPEWLFMESRSRR